VQPYRRGRVQRYSARSGYGFIVDEAAPDGPELFVNGGSLAPGCREGATLRSGAWVRFRAGSRLVNGCVRSPAIGCLSR
jgi:cold shock CspA family protein